MLPRSVIVINWLLALVIIIGIRVSARFILSENIRFSFFNHDFKNQIEVDGSSKSRVLIYGAGDAGMQLSLALKDSSKLHPVGFIDDNKELQGNNIGGLNVYSVNDIEELINELK